MESSRALFHSYRSIFYIMWFDTFEPITNRLFPANSEAQIEIQNISTLVSSELGAPAKSRRTGGAPIRF